MHCELGNFPVSSAVFMPGLRISASPEEMSDNPPAFFLALAEAPNHMAN